MAGSTHDPGPYTLGRFGRQLRRRGPELLRGLPRLVAGVGSLGLDTRLAVQLRLARLVGCPVCLGVFPRLGDKAGLSEAQVADLAAGRKTDLPPEAAGAVAWVEELVLADGTPPEVVPAAAMALSQAQRDHLVGITQLELLVHSAGLMVLPHSLIRRAAGL